MGRFACISPPHIARQLKEMHLLGDYHLLLAHEVAANPSLYSEVYGAYPYEVGDRTLIMDNGVIELGKPVSAEIMHKALSITGADYIILPDVLSDLEATMASSTAAMKDYVPLAELYEAKLMGVVQGRDNNETVDCGYLMAEHLGLSAFGIPRRLANDDVSRYAATQVLNNEFDVHLLGFSNNLVDDIACARIPEVMGIDSSAAVTTGAAGELISLDKNFRISRNNNDPHWWDNMPWMESHGVNVRRIRSWIGEE